jgi:hypothetical protein
MRWGRECESRTFFDNLAVDHVRRLFGHRRHKPGEQIRRATPRFRPEYRGSGWHCAGRRVFLHPGQCGPDEDRERVEQPHHQLGQASGHSIEGEDINDKILFFLTVKGGIAAGWAFRDLKTTGIVPKALVFGTSNPVVAQGAIFAGITLTRDGRVTR